MFKLLTKSGTPINPINYLVVGGGGAGYSPILYDTRISGGGGAGGVVLTGSTNRFVLNRAYNISVGSGGTAGVYGGAASVNGGDTILGFLKAAGGITSTNSIGGSNSVHNGGIQSTYLASIGLSNGKGGGGAGAAGRGNDAITPSYLITTTTTPGGSGVTTTFTGTSLTVGIGGAGGDLTGANGANGTANTGNGGGGGGYYLDTAPEGAVDVAGLGGTGGSGVIIVQIPSQYSASFSGTVTSSTSTSVIGYKTITITATSPGSTITIQ